jgi:hypothetical protein
MELTISQNGTGTTSSDVIKNNSEISYTKGYTLVSPIFDISRYSLHDDERPWDVFIRDYDKQKVFSYLRENKKIVETGARVKKENKQWFSLEIEFTGASGMTRAEANDFYKNKKEEIRKAIIDEVTFIHEEAGRDNDGNFLLKKTNFQLPAIVSVWHEDAGNPHISITYNNFGIRQTEDGKYEVSKAVKMSGDSYQGFIKMLVQKAVSKVDDRIKVENYFHLMREKRQQKKEDITRDYKAAAESYKQAQQQESELLNFLKQSPSLLPESVKKDEQDKEENTFTEEIKKPEEEERRFIPYDQSFIEANIEQEKEALIKSMQRLKAAEQLKDYAIANDKLEYETKQKTAKISELEQNLDTTKKQKQLAESESQKLEFELEEKDYALEEIKKVRDWLESDNEMLHENALVQGEKIQKLENDINLKDLFLGKTREILKDTCLQKRDVKKDLAKTKESLEEKTNKLLESYQNVASLEAKKTELTQELNTQKETNRALAEDLVSANETVDNLEADNMLKAKDLADLMTRVKELEAKNKELEETNKEQSSEILKARETITGLRDQHKKNKAVFEKVKQDRNEYKVIASDKPTPKGLDVFINRAKEDTKQFHQNLYDINQIRGSVNELEKDLEELKEQSFNVDLELLTRNQADIKSERENQDEDVKQDAREEDTKPGEDKEGPR